MRASTAGRRGTALAAVAALLAGGLALGGPAAAAGSATLAPATGTAVKGGALVVVQGTVPEGAVTSARLEGLGVDGGLLVTQEVPATSLRPSRPSGEFLAVEGTTLSGRLGLDCRFSGPLACGPEQEVRRVRLVVAQEGGNVVTSGTARVDHVRPVVRDLDPATTVRRGGYEVVGTDRVRVVFDQPLTHPQGDSPTDWLVTSPDRRVLEVLPATEGDCLGRYLPGEDEEAGATGCTRTLVLDRAVGEDETPTLRYAPSGLAVDRTAQYVDGARNNLSPASSLQTSVDRVRPALPTITAVGGRAPDGGAATGSTAQPEVAVGNLVAGQRLLVRVTAADGTAVQQEVDTTGSTATVVLPALPQQGEGTPYAVTAVVTDAAGNRSDDAGLTPGRADGGPSAVSYVVDTVAPQLVTAVPGSARDVTVVLSEPVSGGGSALDWRITTAAGRQVAVLAVSGSGDRRTLSTLEAVPADAVVAYAPPGSRASDAAGNPLADGSVVVDGLDLPVLTDPVAPVLTRAPSATVRGTAEASSLVALHRDAGDDGTPDGEPLATQQLATGATAFALPVELSRNAATDLVVVVRDPTTGATRSAPVARITHDDTPPTLALTAPAGGEVHAGGSTQDARWSYGDAHPGAVRVELALDGRTFRELSPGAAPGTVFRYVLPRVSTEAARLRVTPRDGAGNTGAPVVSAPFTVDAVPPGFTARTLDARTVRVVLPEPGLTGRSSAVDWRVDGAAVTGAEQSTGPAGETVVLLRLGADLAPDALPEVRYTPSLVSTPYRDRAGQTVEEPVQTAADGTPPGVPVLTAPTAPVLTAEETYLVRGTAQPGVRLEVLDAAGRFVGTTTSAADGAWSVQAVLQPDRVSELRVTARDASDNASGPATVPAVEQDGTAPRVALSAPASGSRLEPGTTATARWTSTDRNPVDGQTLVEISTDGGRTWLVAAQQRAASGSASFDVPEVRTADGRVRVTVPDRVGRRGTAVSAVGIGTEAAAPSLPVLGTYHGLDAGRLLDTRNGTGARPGAVGAGEELRLQVAGREGVPARGAAAVVVNLTAVQAGAKTHIGIVPTGGDTEATASLTVPRGGTVANLVTVRLGSDGALVLRNEAGRTHLLVDVLGWYAAADGSRGAAYSPLAPQRLLDTREGIGAARGQLRSGRTLDLQVTGRGGVPAEGVTSVVLNLAAVGPTRSTHVTAWAAGSSRPETSNLNVARGQTAANLVTVPVGADGRVSLAGSGADVHLVADVFGWYGPGAPSAAVPVDPARVLDTRTGTRQPASDRSDLVLRVAGRGGLPVDGVRAVVLMLTAVAPTDSTHVTAWGSGPRPGTANLNAVRGGTVTSQVVVPVAPDGTVRLAVGKGRVHLVADVAAWFRTP